MKIDFEECKNGTNSEECANESVLDAPKEGLSQDLWKLSEDGETYVLTDSAEQKIHFVIKWLMENGNTTLNSYGVNLIGSMTSNQYSENSDIDLHFNSEEIRVEDADEYTKELRADFERFKEMFEKDDWNIGTHPIEVYFQPNKLQDMMSVGCYDVLNKTWIVGPEIKDMSFDPFAEYYTDDIEYVSQVLDDVRSIILEGYESIMAIRNSKNERFKTFEFGHLNNILGTASKIFQDAREARRRMSSPRTPEEAKSFRISREWKIADSAFKLLDKFGYIAILKTMTQQYEGLKDGTLGRDQVLDNVWNSIQENLTKNFNLDEDERMCFENMQCEGLKDIARGAMLMASLIAAPFSGEAKGNPSSNVEKSAQTQKSGQDDGDEYSPGTIVKDMEQKGISKEQINVLQKQYGGLSYSNNVNMIAWTLWTECRGDVKVFGNKSMYAVASAIMNRANNDPENYVQVISQPEHFSWWNDYSGGWKEGTYVPQQPEKKEIKIKSNKKIWDECNLTAVKLMNRQFKSTIGNRNSYLNKDAASTNAVNTWGKKCTYKIGNHWFGYLPENDGSITYKKDNYGMRAVRTHKIKKGDTISKIARKYDTSIKHILADNPSLKNMKRIRIGTELKIK